MVSMSSSKSKQKVCSLSQSDSHKNLPNNTNKFDLKQDHYENNNVLNHMIFTPRYDDNDAFENQDNMLDNIYTNI